MRLDIERNDLTRPDSRSIYELLRLHILALNDKENAYQVNMMELPLDLGTRILIEVDVVPCQTSSKPV